MDYNYIIDKVYRKASFFIIKKFCEYFDDGRTFEYSLNQIRVDLSNKYIYKNNVYKNYQIFELCIYYFNHHDDYYKKGDSICKVIEKEVKEEFKKKQGKEKIVDKNGNALHQYTFNAFIYDLIVYDTLKRIEGRLGQNTELYLLHFDNNDYNDFTLEKFEGHVVNSEHYRKIYQKFYPNKKPPIAIERINSFNNLHYDIVEDVEEENSNANQNIEKIINIKTTKSINIDFAADISSDEKSFLFWFLCYKILCNNPKEQKFPNTELLRLNSIIDFKDHLSFGKKYRDSRHYKILADGINFFPHNERVSFIEKLLSKLVTLKLNKTIKKIKVLREEIHASHIKTSKIQKKH